MLFRYKNIFAKISTLSLTGVLIVGLFILPSENIGNIFASNSNFSQQILPLQNEEDDEEDSENDDNGGSQNINPESQQSTEGRQSNSNNPQSFVGGSIQQNDEFAFDEQLSDLESRVFSFVSEPFVSALINDNNLNYSIIDFNNLDFVNLFFILLIILLLTTLVILVYRIIIYERKLGNER